MFSTKWQTSPRQYGVTIERDVAIPVRDEVTLDSDIFRPDAPGKFPALLAVHAYSKAAQSVDLMPIGFSYARGFMETGDFNFFVLRLDRHVSRPLLSRRNLQPRVHVALGGLQRPLLPNQKQSEREMGR